MECKFVYWQRKFLIFINSVKKHIKKNAFKYYIKKWKFQKKTCLQNFLCMDERLMTFATIIWIDIWQDAHDMTWHMYDIKKTLGKKILKILIAHLIIYKENFLLFNNSAENRKLLQVKNLLFKIKK